MWELYEQVRGRDPDPVDDDKNTAALLGGVETDWEPFAAFARPMPVMFAVGGSAETTVTVVVWRRRAG